MTDNALCLEAIKASFGAYSPYSSVCVGAALLCADGKLYTGVNIENSAYSPTVCAERVAFFKAVSEGEREFLAIAIAGVRDGKIAKNFPPCGVCRQVMAEFCGADFKILLVNSENSFETLTLGELLPKSFSL